MAESTQKRATVYFDPYLHRALRLKAAETDRSVSDLVNDAVREALAEDAEDLAAFEDRTKEPELKFEDVVKDLKHRGKI
jgi:plasmid stability protein